MFSNQLAHRIQNVMPVLTALFSKKMDRPKVAGVGGGEETR